MTTPPIQIAPLAPTDPIKIPPDVPSLTGEPRSNDRVFFRPPPAEIGPLYRAESTFKIGQHPMAASMHAILWVLAPLPALIIFPLVFMSIRDPDDRLFVAALFAGTALLLGIGLAFYFTRFKVACSYVGELGAVRYNLSGNLTNPPRIQAITFDKATELRTSQTRHFVNGVYTGTHYKFRWTDSRGTLILNLAGQHNGKNGLPKPSDPFHFAVACENAWSMFLLARADEELARNGSLRFNIDARKAVIVGPGFIEFHFSGRNDRCEAADIKSIGLNQGTFSIQHRDAKWYSSKGKFSFPYGNMGNARLFLLVLDRFLPPSTWAQR